jgi:tetratricopeptide (TPR) repeat protein
MIRPTLIDAVLGIVTLATALYFFTAFPRHDPAAARPGAEGQMAAAPIPADAWPICSSMGSIGDIADWAALDPDFAAGKKALASGDWAGAIDALTRAGLRDARNADIQNYLGYAHRRLRQLDQAMGRYRQALALNPRHRSAHEHLGEAYLVLGNLAGAEEQLAALQRICLLPCDEYDDLKQAIAEYDKLVSR